jgi:hypothetical protein
MEPQKHFHIRWANGALDWERHDSRAGAEESAKRLARPSEQYVIEEHAGASTKCLAGPYGETSATA